MERSKEGVERSKEGVERRNEEGRRKGEGTGKGMHISVGLYMYILIGQVIECSSCFYCVHVA